MKLLFSLLIAGALFAQQDRSVVWRASVIDLERRMSPLTGATRASAEAWRADAEDLRASLVQFAESRSDLSLHLPPALGDQPSLDNFRQQLNQLKTAVDEVIQNTPDSLFNLGRVEVTVSATITAPSPVADDIDQTVIRNLGLTTAAKALDYLPGVSIQHIATNRNEAGIMVRGFSTRGQVPLYLDGIPISVPYDGYIDLNRFLTSDIAEVQVSRGYSSPLLGPNALGGSVNLVTQEPTKKVNADALIGTGSGDTLLSSLRLG